MRQIAAAGFLAAASLLAAPSLRGPDGFLYLTDEVSVRRVSAAGEVRTIARGGPLLKPSHLSRFFEGRFGKMMGLAVDEKGTVYTANYGGRRVVQVTPEGRVTSVHGGWGPSGVALFRGELYVLEHGRGISVRVRRLSLSGGPPATLAVIRHGHPAAR